jgi:hypothetical protein
MRRAVLGTLLCVFMTAPAAAQQPLLYNQSTGADGALDSASNCTIWATSQSCYIQVPESGVLNFTTITIPANTYLYIRPNFKNTPVYLLAQGAVSIAGRIYLFPNWDWIHHPSVATGTDYGWPGAGGFYGARLGGPGAGPGGGLAAAAAAGGNGKWVGPLSLVPIVGGSGGGSLSTGYGGGGGGAIVIASATSILLSSGAQINVNGGNPGASQSYGGFGSGGAIRLVANSISVESGASLNASSGGGAESAGVIRLEAPYGALTFAGSANPTASLVYSINETVIPAVRASLQIKSVGGYPVPANSGSRQDVADLLLPRAASDPINVVVEAAQVPVGTQVTLTVTPGIGVTTVPGTLTGSTESSTATLQFSNASRTALSYLFVCATFSVPDTVPQPDQPPADRVARIRLEAAPGRPERVVFLRSDGSEIDPARVPAVLQERLLTRQ